MKRLKVLRDDKKISQQKLASDLNLSQASISKYENGTAEPDIRTILMLSEYFSVSTDYIIGHSDRKAVMSTDDLTDDEIEIILIYRQLTENHKQKAAAYLAGLSDQ